MLHSLKKDSLNQTVLFLIVSLDFGFYVEAFFFFSSLVILNKSCIFYAHPFVLYLADIWIWTVEMNKNGFYVFENL